jgi:hypothetical protein
MAAENRTYITDISSSHIYLELMLWKSISSMVFHSMIMWLQLCFSLKKRITLTLQSPVVTICTTCFNVPKLCILPPVYLCILYGSRKRTTVFLGSVLWGLHATTVQGSRFPLSHMWKRKFPHPPHWHYSPGWALSLLQESLPFILSSGNHIPPPTSYSCSFFFNLLLPS